MKPEIDILAGCRRLVIQQGFAWLLMLMLFPRLAPAQSNPHLYVKWNATGTQTGASWTNAFHEIDDAVAAAETREIPEVWVAAGTYQRPVTMRWGVAVYGGFAGTETSLAQRKPATNLTIIDVSRAQGGAPAAHAVLFMDVGGAVLDGVRVSGGRASASGDRDGGGIVGRIPEDEEIRIVHCTISGNTALGNGGGVCILAGAARLIDCLVTNNTAQGLGGGVALFGTGGCVNDCTIRGNTAASGGGFAGGGPGAGLRNCDVLFNRASVQGGGVAANDALTLTNCRLLNNQAPRGGGAWCSPSGSLSAQGCAIAGNAATGQGGGILHEGAHDLERGWLTECTLSGNSAAEGGGLTARTPLALHDSLLSGNTATRGGALSVDAPWIDLFGCTLADNTATSGGAFFAAAAPQATLEGCIFSGNMGRAIRIGRAATTEGLHLRYDLFNGNLPGDYHDGAAAWNGAGQLNSLAPACFGNLEGDPHFPAGAAGAWSAPPVFDAATSQTTLTNSAAAFTPNALAGRLIALDGERGWQALILQNTATAITLAGDWTRFGAAGATYQILDYHLGDGSRALGGSFPRLPAANDIDNEPRSPVNGWIDSGADEAAAAATAPPPIPDGRAPVSRVEPLPSTFRGAVLPLEITAADDCGGVARVRLFYRRDGGPWLPDCEFVMRSGQTIACRFDADAAGGGGYFEFYTVATDEAGNAESPPPVPDAATRISIPFPDHCVWVNSQATGSQDGETWDTAYRQICDGIDCALAEKLSLVRVAGGKYAENVEMASGLTLEGGYFRNTDGTFGRDPIAHPSILVAVIEYYDPTLRPSVMTLNGTQNTRLDGLTLTGGDSATGSGLLLRDCDASNIVSNCVITANHAWNGAGVYCDGQTQAVLSGCRILGNAADEDGGGIVIDNGARPRLVNCILWGNTAARGGALAIAGGAAPEVIHCTLSDNTATTGGAIACHGLAGAAPSILGSILRGSKGVGALAELDGGSDPQLRGCLFDGNAGGDYLNEGRTVLNGAAAIDALAEADGDFSGAAALPAGPTGKWSAAPAYSAATGCTTLTNSSATFTAGGLVGRLLNADTGQPLAALVVANTTKAVTVAGDLTGYAHKNDSYQFADARPIEGSAAIDRVALTGAPTADIDGNPRPFDAPGQGNEGVGTIYDIGACEGRPRLLVTGTTSSGTLDFGTQSVEKLPGASKTLTLVNQGSLGLLFSQPALAITGADAPDFAVAGGFSTAPLAAGDSRSLTVTFLPKAAGTRQGRLDLWTQGAAAPFLSVILTGNAIDERPVITAQPASQTVNPGARVSFTVAAGGLPPLAWRWRKNGATLSDGGSLSGATSCTLALTGAQQSDEGVYDCVVTNSAGQAISQGATLAVNDPPAITRQPAAQTVNPGATVAFDTAATGTLPLQYQWRRNGAALTANARIQGVNTGNLIIYSVIEADEGGYDCVATNMAGQAISNAASLTVNDPPVVVTQPADLTLDPGEAAAFDTAASSTLPMTYSWYRGSLPLGNGGRISGADTPALRIAAVQRNDGGEYSCRIANAAGAVTTRRTWLNVTGPAAIAEQPGDVVVDPGVTASFHVVAIGTEPLAWQWFKDGNPLADGGRLSGATSATLTLAEVDRSDAGDYACQVGNAFGSDLSSAARLTVNPMLTVASPHGSAAPPVGCRAFTTGTLVNAAIAASPELDANGTTRYLATGWLGSGAVAASGATTQTTFVLDRDSSLTWHWKTQYLIETAASPPEGGRVVLADGITPAAGWRDAGSQVTIQAGSQTGYRFLNWTGDLAGTENTVAITLDRPLRAVACYVEATPPTGSLRINGGAAWTSTTAVTLTLTASDAGSGLGLMRFSNDGAVWSAWENYAPIRVWGVGAGDGNRTVYVEFQDRAGNISPAYSAAIGLDRTAPVSAVTAPNGTTLKRMLPVNWSASDPQPGAAASGLKAVEIFWRRNAGAWQLLGSFAPGVTGAVLDTQAAGGAGVYEFYSAATDLAGNTEAPPAKPDTAVTVDPNGVAAGWRWYE